MTMASQPAQDGPVIHELDGAAPHPGLALDAAVRGDRGRRCSW